jgi:hypothetical protein
MLLLLHMPAAADITTTADVEDSWAWDREADPTSTYEKTEDNAS